MDKSREDYGVEDLLTDRSFLNYHFHSNKEDQLSWEKWLINHREKKAMVNQASDLLQTLSLTISDKEFSRELEKMKAAITTKAPQPLYRNLSWANKSVITRRSKRVLYVVPILLILMVGGYLLWPVLVNNTKQLTETVNNTNGQLFLTLSDSTVVTLLAHSSLKYPLYFERNKRNVYLKGDAQFNVKRNVDAPFKVYAENVVATVLGTIFNFKKSGDSIVVELLKGKLNVEIVDDKSKTGKSIVLYPDEKATYVRHDKHFYKNQPQQFTVRFYKNNFEEIADQVKNIFGTTVINESNNKSWRFTGEFKNSTAKEVIENICLVKNLSAEVKGDTIFIK